MARRNPPPEQPEGKPPAEIAAQERREQNPLPGPPPAVPPAADPQAETPALIDDWLAIEPDGSLTVFTGKVELGTGTRTALSQIAAEELDQPLERVRLVMGDTDRTPDEGYTAGSMTIRMAGAALRQAAAEARQVLLELASERLDAALDELTIEPGLIRVAHHPDRLVTLADLMGGQRFDRPVTGRAPLKDPAHYRVVGASAQRLDLPGKLLGQPSFIHDLRLPGMLHARVVAPPSPGADLRALDATSVDGLPGLVTVFQRGNFVAVIAEREDQAVRAAQQLRLEWDEPPTLPRPEALFDRLRADIARDDVLRAEGDPEAGLRHAARTLRAVYSLPYAAHASIGPACAVADASGETITVWSNTQGTHPLRGALVELLGLPPERIRVCHMEGAGAYGQTGADDAAAHAAVLSQAVGRPVRVQWSRETEFLWEPKAAAMQMEVRGGLDAAGNVVAWDYHLYTPSHSARPRLARQLLAAQWMERQPPPVPARYSGGDRNALSRYTFPNQRVTVHWARVSPLRVSSFRSLGGAGNTFANECFIDELAAAAGADPVAYRLRYLDDPRSQAVLKAAAERAGWDPRPAPRLAPRSAAGLAEGRGVAFARYKYTEAYVATVAEVAVDSASGALRVQRLVVAHDCGLIINPDGLRNQIEGNTIQSLSRAIKEEVRFDEVRQTSRDWETYPILTFSEVPEVEIVLINRPDQPALGAGEPASITTAPAVANAIFDAVGVRVRQLPLTSDRIRAALAAG